MIHYYDPTTSDACIGIIPNPGDTVILTGTKIHSEPAKYRGCMLSERFVRECDFHFWFDDEDPAVDIYTVPMVEVGGFDSHGGLFAGMDDFTIGRGEPMYYIDAYGKCFLITEDSGEFLSLGQSWRQHMTPSDAIEVFSSKAEARRKYNIKDMKCPGEDEI